MANQFRGARRAPFVRGPKRQTGWAASSDISAFTALAANTIVLDQTLTEAELIHTVPATIVRTRGLLLVRSDQLGASEIPFGALGMSVVSEQARAVGVTAVPAPITDEDSDLFFVHQFWAVQNRFSSGVGFSQSTTTYAFDSKAMRKVAEGDAVAVVMQNASALAGVDYVLKFRMLFKLQ